MKRLLILFTLLFCVPLHANLLKQSTNRNVEVLMIDASDNVTGKTGLTLTITASKDGGAFGSISPTVTELSSGWYSLALTSAHTNTLGDLALHITGTGANATDIRDQVVADLPGATVSSVTGDVGGNVVGSVASVTGAVGSVTSGVTVTTNNDKTGYSLASASLPVKKNTALNNFQFPIYGTSASSPTTGLSVSCQRAIDNGTFASCANSVSEIGTTGYYKVNFAAADLNGDTIVVRFYGTGVREKSITFITQ